MIDMSMRDLCLVLSLVSGLAHAYYTQRSKRHLDPAYVGTWLRPFFWRPRTAFTTEGWRYRNIALHLLWPATGFLLGWGFSGSAGPLFAGLTNPLVAPRGNCWVH